MTCLPPFGKCDVGVLWEVWNAIRNNEAPLVEGWKGESWGLRRFCSLAVLQEAITDCLIDIEAVYSPALQPVSTQSQVGHQALCNEETRQEEQRRSFTAR